MSLSEMLLPEFDQEMAGTRKVLERVPDDRFDWRPHERSMALGRLASHIAEIPGLAENTLTATEFDMKPAGGKPYTPPTVTTRQEVLELFDTNVTAARAAIAGADDEDFGVTWALKSGGQEIFSLPRLAVIRGMVLNHLIHHRAQMGVYLRLNELPVPSLYGPSADDNPFA